MQSILLLHWLRRGGSATGAEALVAPIGFGNHFFPRWLHMSVSINWFLLRQSYGRVRLHNGQVGLSGVSSKLVPTVSVGSDLLLGHFFVSSAA